MNANMLEQSSTTDKAYCDDNYNEAVKTRFLTASLISFYAQSPKIGECDYLAKAIFFLKFTNLRSFQILYKVEIPKFMTIARKGVGSPNLKKNSKDLEFLSR